MISDNPSYNSPTVSVLTTPGFVYFIQGAAVPLIKIGWTINVEWRLSQLQMGSPDRLVVLAWLPANGRQEKDLHRRFGAARSHGEWFQPVPELLSYIRWAGKGRRRKWRPAA